MKKMMSLLTMVTCFGASQAKAQPPQNHHNPRPSTAAWVAMLDKGEELANAVNSHQRLQGTQLLLRSQKLAPSEFKTLVAASRASMLRGFASSKPEEMVRWGKRGWAYGREIVRRWPERAEGYYWSAIHLGLISKGSAPTTVLFNGYHTQMEKMAQIGIQKSPDSYLGIGQRILGRYYFRLPWPMRDVNKSLRYLRVAYRLAPNDALAVFYYAETLWELGQKDTAKALYRRCAKIPSNRPLAHPVQLPMRDAVQRCRKKLHDLR
ncbi:hypothetical protein L6R29_25885 [Myxococcota bacterium]|nr:hypothetical protein [Myxococcota bacterium]